MNELTDEEMQRLFDESLLPQDVETSATEDLEAYRLLFVALKKEPPGGLPPDFSQRVVSQLPVRSNFLTSTLFHVLVVMMVVAVFSLGFLMMGGLHAEAVDTALTSLQEAKSWLVFGLLCFVVIQVIDTKLSKVSLLAGR